MGAAADEPDHASTAPAPLSSSLPPPPQPLQLRELRAVAVLGRGAKGVVFLVRPENHSPPEDGAGRHHHHHHLALKAISHRLIRSGSDKTKERPGGATGTAYRRVEFERDILASLDHPLLPALRGVVSTDEIVGFAIDRCSGGTLDALRKRQTEQMFSEEAIRFYAAELVLALEHLHGLGVVYRDLKPDNVLIQGNGHIMLVDFDLSTRLPTTIAPTQPPPGTTSSAPSSPEATSTSHSPSRSHHRQTQRRRRRRAFLHSWLSCGPRAYSSTALNDLSSSVSSSSSGSSGAAPASSTTTSASYSSLTKSNSFVGTEEYVAPEVIRGTGHDFSVDWWGLGVVLYEMLYGRTPFRGQNRKETFYRVLSKEPDLAGEATALRDLIGRLLDKDPEKRLRLDGIKSHEFFAGVDWDSVTNIARPPFIPVETDHGFEDEEEEGIDVEGFVRGLFFPDGGSAAADTAGSNDEGKKKSGGQQQPDGGDRAPKDAAGMENVTDVVDTHDNTWVQGLPKPSQDHHFSAF